jgi:DNA-binding transcriptional MocR family regulator
MNWLELLNSLESDKERNEPLYAQIMHRIEAAITSGQLPDNSRLPTNRELAALLKIDRSTVARAYLELSQSGMIESHVGRGTFVRPAHLRQKSRPESKANPPMVWSEKFARASQTAYDIMSRQPATTALGSDMISFAGGIPTEEFYPHEQFERMVRQLVKSGQCNEMFGYSPAEGHPLLRDEVKKHLQLQGIKADDDQLLIVSGSQQAIDLVTNVLVDPQDNVLLEEPSYFWAILNFRSRQARCVAVPVDDDGLRTDALESILARQKAKLLYVMPSFQNPTGATMPIERRKRLLELAQEYCLPILEDNFVGDLNYDAPKLPPLKAMPQGQDLVIYQGTFSKALCPGLRLGWLVAPRDVMSRLRLAKRTSDLSTNSTAQIILAKYLNEGLYAAHLDGVRKIYQSRRDTMLDALKKIGSYEGLRVKFSQPQGGLFVWAKLPQGLSARELLNYAEREGVTFSPGDLFFVNQDRQEYFRLCFIQTDEAVIQEGVDRLARAVSTYFEQMAKSNAYAYIARAKSSEHVLI